jgi:hypothetical protein
MFLDLLFLFSGSTSNAGPTGPCYAGFYCTGGATSPYQNANPPGYFTTNGSSAATPCPVGTYAPGGSSSTCLICDAGYFCANQSTVFIQPCPAGAYCDAGSSYSTACPPGTFNAYTRGKNISACVSCPAGQYCQGSGLTAPTNPCDAGFYCVGGSQISNPQTLNVGGLVCPISFYCPQGTAAPYPCANGTFTSSPGSMSQADCQECPAGKACIQNGLIVSGMVPTCGLGPPSPTSFPGTVPVDCAAGYWCARGATTTTPTDGVTGDICPAGSRCPAASSGPIICDAGYYQNRTGQSTCLDCPAGSYCTAGATTSTNLCPIGYYCPPNTLSAFQFPCPVGRYGLAGGAISLNAGCAPCPAGSFCDSYHATSPAGLCHAGFYWYVMPSHEH